MTVGVRFVTPSPLPGGLYCDEFHRKASYTNWRPTGSGDWLLIYTVAGAGHLVSDQGTSRVHPGDILLYAPGEPQDYSTSPEVGKWHLLWAHFTPKPHWQAWMHWPTDKNGFKLLHIEEGEVRRELCAALRYSAQLLKRALPIATDLAMLSLEEALLWINLAASRDQWVTMDGRVREAINYLTQHFREPFQLVKLARHCGLSVYRLAHLFKEETGFSPQRFLEKHRMEIASRLLRLTGFTIAEIATEVGYDDPFYFSNRFRRYSGKSPSQFRAAKPRLRRG